MVDKRTSPTRPRAFTRPLIEVALTLPSTPSMSIEPFTISIDSSMALRGTVNEYSTVAGIIVTSLAAAEVLVLVRILGFDSDVFLGCVDFDFRFVQSIFAICFFDCVDLNRRLVPNFDLHAAVDVFETDATGWRQWIRLMKLFAQLVAWLTGRRQRLSSLLLEPTARACVPGATFGCWPAPFLAMAIISKTALMRLFLNISFFVSY